MQQISQTLKNQSSAFQPALCLAGRICQDLLREFFSKHSICNSHGYQHILRVHQHTLRALYAYNMNGAVNPRLKQCVQLAALLHDVDDSKLFPANRNNENLREFISRINMSTSAGEQPLISSEDEKAIIRMVNLVSFSHSGDSYDQADPIVYYFPRYADRLQAIGVVGIIRAYEYTKSSGRELYTSETLRPSNLQELASCIKGRDKQYIERRGKSQSFIDHFYDKLLHIKLPQIVAQNSYFQSAFESYKQLMEKFVLDMVKSDFKEIDKTVEGLINQSSYFSVL